MLAVESRDGGLVPVVERERLVFISLSGDSIGAPVRGFVAAVRVRVRVRVRAEEDGSGGWMWVRWEFCDWVKTLPRLLNLRI